MILPEGKQSKQSLLSSISSTISSASTVSLSELSTIQSGHSKSPLSESSAPPPRYFEKQPQTGVTYTFFPQTTPVNSMVMKPPTYLDEYPSYYISVNMNCFTPCSYITMIRRDGWDGEVIGEFEMGVPGVRRLNTVYLYGNEVPIDEVVESNTKMFRGGSYIWKRKSDIGPSTVDLYWEECSAGSNSNLTCFLGREKRATSTNNLAKFMPSSMLRKPGRAKDPQLTRLDVTSQGHAYLDEIVMSVLIIERIRTSPSALKDLPSSMLKEFF